MSSAAQIAEFIKQHDNFLVTAHVFPDGDNLGSILAISEVLDTLGKSCQCFLEGDIPKMYTWMPGCERISDDLDASLAKLSINGASPTLLVLDSGDPERVGSRFTSWLENQNSIPTANVDHHISNTFFGTVNWVDGGYSSVGEMLFEVLRELEIELTRSLAQNIFVSIYTDTGRFSFSNTSPKSLRYASECVAAGAKPIDAFRHIYASRSMESFNLQVESFQTLTKFLDGDGCYFWVSRKMLEKTGTTLDDADGFIDFVRTLKDFSIVVFFKEVEEGDIRASVRAHPPINASMLMSLFGGGGHPRAAGCRLMESLNSAIERFVDRAEVAIKSGEVLERDD